MQRCILAIAIVLGFSSWALADETEFVAEQICCVLEEGHTIEEINARWGTTTIHADLENDFYLLHVEGVEDLLEFVERMAGDEAIDIVDVNWYLEAPESVRQMVVTAIGGTYEEYVDQSMTARIGLDAAHAITRGEGVTVAVLDTGVDPQHEVFAGRLSAFRYDCLEFDFEPWETANGEDDDGDGEIDEGFGHGTMVAGLVALIAPDAQIMPIRVLDDDGRGTLFAIAKGMIAACAHEAQIINASFGTPNVVETISRRLRVASMHQVMTVAGAGNRDLEFPAYHPACDELAFMVTALDSADVKAGFADFSAHVIVSAPGVGLRSAYPGGWANGSGCSFATPLVAGEMALLLSAEPSLTFEQMGAALETGVDPIYGHAGNQAYLGKLGTGRINLPRALGETSSVPAALDGGARLRIWPNPALGEIRMDYSAPGSGPWRLAIYDASGRLVHRGEWTAGEPVVWSARDLSGRRVAPGTYFAKLTGGRQTANAAVTVLR